jgi:hypothetical protein
MWTDRQADRTKLIVVFRYFAAAPKNLFLISRIEIRFLACPARSLVTILTELFGPPPAAAAAAAAAAYPVGTMQTVPHRACRKDMSSPLDTEVVKYITLLGDTA